MDIRYIHGHICKIPLWGASLIALTLGGCDDGKIYPDDSGIAITGFSVILKGELTGCDQYADTQYTVALAVFEDSNEFAVVSKNLNDGNDDITMTNVDRKVSTVEVCIINRLRKRVITLVSQTLGATDEDVVFNIGELDASPFAVICNDIFTKSCLQCHGGTGTPAAGLDLNPSKAYADLVNVPSSVVEGELIVNPDDASASTLWQVVATDISETWRFDHSNLLTSEKSSFIESWINNGAHD